MISLFEKSPEASKSWDYKRNSPLTPKDVTFGSNRIVWWICPKCDEPFQQRIKRQRDRDSCVECSRAEGLKRTALTLKKAAGLIDAIPILKAEYSKNNATPITNWSIKAYYWVLWVCSVCNEEFSACISERVQGKGYCPVCTGKKLKIGFNDVATVAPEIAHELPDASLIVGKSRTPIDWLCSVCSKEWRASPKARLGGRACPHCRAQTKVTRGQRELTEFLTAISPVESDVKIPGSLMEIDCYLPEFGVGFEFNGDYWHSDNVTVPRRGETSKDRELRKLRLAADAGVRLFIVWESDWLTVRAEVETAIEDALAGGEPKLLLKVAGVPFDRPRSAVSTRKGSLIEEDFGPEHYEEFRERYFAEKSPAAYTKAKGFTKTRVYSYVQAHSLDEERFRKYGVTKNGGRTAKAVREQVERMEKADSES